MSKYEDEDDFGPGWFYSIFGQGCGLVVLIIFGVLLLGSLVTFVGYKTGIWLQPAARQATNLNATNRQAVDQWFAQTLADIQTSKTQLATFQQQLQQFQVAHPDPTKWNYADQEEYTQLTTNIAAFQNRIADLANQYNARVKNYDYCIASDVQFHQLLNPNTGDVEQTNVACPSEPSNP